MNTKERILLYGANIWYLGEGMLGPLLAVFTERIGGDILDITWAWAIYLIVTGVLYIIVGRIADARFDKAKIMVLGYALNALFTFAFLFVTKTSQLFIVQAGLAVAAAFATPTWNALYAQYEDKNHDIWQWGVAGGEASIITGIAILLGGMIVNYLSFEILFFLMGIIQTVATLYQARILLLKSS